MFRMPASMQLHASAHTSNSMCSTGKGVLLRQRLLPCTQQCKHDVASPLNYLRA
jgi:hypothetical protein